MVSLARDRGPGPRACKLEQELFLSLGLGLGDPEQGLFGVFQELIRFRHCHHPSVTNAPLAMQPLPLAGASLFKIAHPLHFMNACVIST
jgi:hypothetical protein